MAPDQQRLLKWIDGLRGIASVLVICTHLARAWDHDLFMPRSAEDVPPRLLQLPFLRIPGQGRLSVAIFAFLTGYVSALKPLRLTRSGNPGSALSTLAKSAFRRIPRLVMPTTIATILAWALCQAGAFEVAKRSDAAWIAEASPQLKTFPGDALRSLWRELVQTWASGHNMYDHHQWTMLPLLQSSMMVHLALVGTVYMLPKYRMTAILLLYCYYFACRDATFNTQACWGMFLSELAHHPPAQAYISSSKWLTTIVPPILISIALFLCSYPQDRPEWSAWSKVMADFAPWLFPYEADVPRFYTALGIELFTLGVQLSDVTKEFLSNKYLLWLGKNSFAVYLLHGTLLRTVLVWMFYGAIVPPNPNMTVNDKGEIPPTEPLHLLAPPFLIIGLAIWFGIVYFIADFWTKHIDGFCGRVTQALEAYVFDDNDEKASRRPKNRSTLDLEGLRRMDGSPP